MTASKNHRYNGIARRPQRHFQPGTGDPPGSDWLDNVGVARRHQARHYKAMSKVTLTTELAMSAGAAAALARKPEMMAYVLSPVLRIYHLEVPDNIEVGTQGSARFWLFGVIPAWTHHLTVIQLDPTEIYTHEHGGPVHTWNHRLTFEPVDDQRCRYIDEIETDDGLRGAPTRLFIKLMFRYRHRRWRTLANILN